MTITLLDAGSLPAGAMNEDAWGAAGGCAWVLDGATGLGRNVVSAESDAAWFAHAMSDGLRARLEAAPKRALEDVIAEALEALAAEYQQALGLLTIEPFEFPSAAGMLVSLGSDVASLLWMGDCRAYWREAGALQSAGGGMIDQFDETGIEALKAFFATHPEASLAEGRAHVWPLLQRQRTGLNREGGYWAWAPQVGLLPRADRGAAPRGAGPLLIASDGFTRLWDTFAIASPEEALDACARGEGMRLAQALRAAETADAGGRDNPRFKQFDDCTWLCLQI